MESDALVWYSSYALEPSSYGAVRRGAGEVSGESLPVCRPWEA